ncbi:transposable element Tcb1 transposase [Trichonephila clavipes]|nr:transposable element Tcb1 transposase [Trichonephila clavipes]
MKKEAFKGASLVLNYLQANYRPSTDIVFPKRGIKQWFSLQLIKAFKPFSVRGRVVSSLLFGVIILKQHSPLSKYSQSERAPGTRYHQKNTIERHRYGGAGWLVWGGIILGSRTDLHVQSVTITGQLYRDVILEQHVRLFRGAMGAEFLFMDDNARPHCGNIVD